MKLAVLSLMMLFFTCSCLACDNTILTILAGRSASEMSLAKFLAISEQLKKEGDMITAFNLSAAKQAHKEVLQAWLKLMTELGVAPLVKEDYRKEYLQLLSEIAKDLGRVRKNLSQGKLISTHELIENCVTKISILGAQINDQQLVYNFLKFELMVYEPGNLLDRPLDFSEQSYLPNIKDVLLKNPFYQKSTSITDGFFVMLDMHRDNIDKFKENKIGFDSLAVSYNDLKNSFVGIKKKLLDEGYFT